LGSNGRGRRGRRLGRVREKQKKEDEMPGYAHVIVLIDRLLAPLFPENAPRRQMRLEIGGKSDSNNV